MAVSTEHGPVTSVNGWPMARVINAVLGVWLFISAFAWPHLAAQRTNAAICGVLCVVFALVATSVPRVRYLNSLLAIWLFISSWAMAVERIGTLWNNVLVAIAIFVVSLVANGQPSSTHMEFTRRQSPPRAA